MNPGDTGYDYEEGNNKWDADEIPLFSNDPDHTGFGVDVVGGETYGLYTPGGIGSLPGDSTAYIGMYWCYGNIEVDKSLFTLDCDGSGLNNITQTDAMEADFSFYVEQARHNDEFSCEDN